MHFPSSSRSSLPASLGGLALSLAALGLAALAPSARAQTQDLFVSNFSNNIISRFAGTGPGTFSTSATALPGSGLNGPYGLAFDGGGDLFVTNYAGGRYSNGSITEFASTGAGTFAMGMPFATGLNGPIGLAFDARGDLFAANQTGNSIMEFASTGAGTFGTGMTVATGLDDPIGLAFDGRGDLFVTNYTGGSTRHGSITEFASTGAGTFGAGRTVEDQLSQPTFLAFSPVPAVPEASTTVSLGLLLALGMGGMVVAAKRKKRA